MGYLRSSIIIQPTKLYKVTIYMSWFYFGETFIHETFATLGECRDWLIQQRCELLDYDKSKIVTFAEVVKKQKEKDKK